MKIAIRNPLVVSPHNGTILVKRASIYVSDEKIMKVGELTGDFRESTAEEVIEAEDSVVIPGLVNLHSHSGPTAVRGFAEDMRLSEWLEKYVNPAHRLLTRDVAEADYTLSYAEMLKSGITHVLDLYRYPDVGVSVADKLGIRATIAPYASDVYEYFENPKHEANAIKSSRGRLGRVWAGFEHLSYCTDECLDVISETSRELGVGVHTHEFETLEFVQRALEAHGDRPLNVMKKHGLLNERLVLAHVVWPTYSELRELSAAGVSVSHNPTSNMKLASGVAPLVSMISLGINVGLGTDGSKENNRFDMFQEMKTSVLLQRALHIRADAIKAADAFIMATANGSRALKMSSGRIEENYLADMDIIDASAINMRPLSEGNAIAQLVYSCHPGNVKHVIVNGEVVVRDGKLTKVNEDEEIERATAKVKQLSRSLGLGVSP